MKRKLIVVFALFVAVFCFAACKKNTDGQKKDVYALSGVKDVELTVNDTSYDFLQGVTGKKNGKDETVTVKAEGVNFGKAGVYDVVYTCGTEKESAKVYIYTADRKSAITADDITLTYEEALEADSLLKGVVATDKLGKTISAAVTSDYEKNEYGLIKVGEHTVTYSAGEGEEAKTATRKVTVTAGENLPVLSDAATDLKKPEISFNVEGGVFVGLYTTDGEAGDDDYILNNNVLTLVGDYIETLGEGEHVLCVLFTKGYVTVKVTVTDDQALDYAVEDLFDENNYLVGDEVVFARGVRGEYSRQNITFTYKLDGEPVTDASKIFDEAGKHTFEITATRGKTSDTKTYNFDVLTTENYYGQNFVNKQNVALWVSGNNDAVTYVDATDTASGYFVLKHTSGNGGNERCFYIKDLMQDAIAAGMNELYVKMSSAANQSFYIDAYELDAANYYDSPWGRQPWNMVSPMLTGSVSTDVTSLKLTLDDAYAPASSTGNLMMFGVTKDTALNVSEISFGRADHSVAYQQSYEDKNVISASVTIKGDANLENLEFYITDKTASIKGARAGYGMVLCKDPSNWNGWIGINAYSASPVQKFDITKTADMGPGYPAGPASTDNGKIGCCSPLHPEIFNDRTGYYNTDGTKTFTVKFIPDYETNNTYMEFYFGTQKFFTVIPTKAEEMKSIITTGKVIVLVNGNSVAASDYVTGFEAKAEKQNFWTYEGIENVELSVGDTSYDFESGVKVKLNGEEVEFTCDASAVEYGKVGEYDVTYTAGGEFTKTVKAKICAFEASASTTLSVMNRKTTLGTVTKVYAEEGTYTITYKLNGDEIDIEELKDGDKYVKVFDQPGDYVWEISVKIGNLDVATSSETIHVVTTTEMLNTTSKVNDVNKVTIEFTVNNSASFESLEIYLGAKTKTYANARISSVGLQLYNDRLVLEGFDGKGNQGDAEFMFDNTDGVKVNDSERGKTSSSGQVVGAKSLLCHGAYYEYYGGESKTKRNMKFVFTKLDTGYTQVEYYLGDAETGEYTKMFAVWMEDSCGGAADQKPRFKWPTKNVYANIAVNGSVDANANISNYKVTVEKAQA